jgi:hypothetical protein
MKFEKIEIPEFLLAEIPVKDKTIHDNRIWINATKWLSLIEVYCEGDVDFAFPMNLIQKKYTYVNTEGVTETWVLVFVQNNIGFIDSDKNPVDVLDDAWRFFEIYLTWEDINLDFE